ncbi:MAG: DUF2279 domain-containing protein [Polaromonas sp.]|uniref:DUF2279 domain-containing protein n=1 Tax=Polaromonas sp. TaxID=1869339 RepID=UPI0027303BDE|nr:DUF2279 domain-containing protein [Polaromonas sp.]MDP2256461.1 DUF2279 domain-containing protein [Polaromonas sp.]
MWIDLLLKARRPRPAAVLALTLIFAAQLAMAQQEGWGVAVSNDATAVAAAPDTSGTPAALPAGDEPQTPADEAPAAAKPVPAVSATTELERAQPAAVSERTTRFRTAALMAASIGGTLAYGRAKWWQDGFGGGFKTVNEGWFGQDTRYGGADKLGHAMFAYTGTRLLTQAFGWAGHDSSTALKLGLWTSVGTLMGVELIDGFSRKWRFSKEDALANLAGGALAYVLERNPELDALLDLRLQYSSPSGGRQFDPFGDYSSQRYLLVLKASGVPALKQHPLLKYLEINLGYGARTFDSDSRAPTQLSRHAYFGVSLNLSELLRNTVYKGNASPTRTQQVTETLFEFMQIPAATVQSERDIR